MSSHSSLMRRAYRLLLCLTLLCAPVSVLAQSTGTIEGIVRDARSGEPLVGATISLRDASDTSAKSIGDLTDATGAFRIERVSLGRRYKLEASYLGYTPSTVDDVVVIAAEPTFRLPDLGLEPSAVGMETVRVEAKRPDVAVLADKTVYAVENNPSYTATNVSELLGQIPSIDVDQEGKVSLRGDDNVTIMMNDRPLTMPADQRNKFLQSLPASMVKDIEVRTNPGARFDAKSQAGIINIVTRRTMGDMLGGNVNAGIDSRVGVNTGAGLYLNGEELSASLGGGINRGRNAGASDVQRWNFLDSVERHIDGGGASESTFRAYYGYGQVDYKITAQDLLSVSFSLNSWSSEYTSFSGNTFFDAAGAVVTRSYDTSGPGEGASNSGGYNSASLLLKHTFAGDHKLSLDVSYNGNGYEGANQYSSTYRRSSGELDSIRSIARRSAFDRTTSTIISTLDYDNPLSEALTMSLGAKNEINLLDNTTDVHVREGASSSFERDSLQSNHYRPENSIYAAYVDVSWRPVQALGLQAGARVEHALVSASYASGEEIVARRYTNLFPSGTLTWSVSDEHSLALGYRRSVALPDIDALNPTRVRWSDLYEQSGNPDLEPELTNHFELRYNTFWGMGNMVSLSPYYATTDGNIETSQRLVGNVTHSSSVNFNGAWSLGASASVAMRPLSWLNFRIAADLFRKVNRGSDIPGDLYSEANGYNGNASVNADITEGLTFSLSGYTSRPATVGASRSGGWSFWSVSLRQRLLDKKLTISLRLNDPLNLQKWESTYESSQFRTETTSKWTSRFVGLNVSYAFGTQPRLEQHKVEKTETKGSGGSGGGGGGGGDTGGGGGGQ